MYWILAILAAVKDGYFLLEEFQFPPSKKQSVLNTLRNLGFEGYLVKERKGVYRRTDKQWIKGSKGERMVAGYLDKLGLTYRREVTTPTLKGEGGGLLRYDFVVSLGDREMVIEFHGRQHYEKVAYFGGTPAFEKRVRHDEKKKEHALKRGLEHLEINDENCPQNTPQAAALFGVPPPTKARKGLIFK